MSLCPNWDRTLDWMVPTRGEDATADEYMNARDAARSAEIARLLEFIDR